MVVPCQLVSDFVLLIEGIVTSGPLGSPIQYITLYFVHSEVLFVCRTRYASCSEAAAAAV